MPDFEKIRIGARVKAEFPFRGEIKNAEVDGFFDVVIPSLTTADTTLVAVLMNDRRKLEYRHFDGKLFRPMLQAGFAPWKLGDERHSRPPVVNGAPFRIMGNYRETPLLASPWLDWMPENEDVSEAMRARVKRAAPEAWDAVGRGMTSLASRGLRLIDGVLFHETRAPGWGIKADGVARIAIKPAMVDAIEGLPHLLLDARIAPPDLRAIGRRLNAQVPDGLRVLEPSLLPDTVESDCIAAFALWAYGKVSGVPVGGFDIDRLSDVLGFVGAAEKMAREGLPPTDCLERLEWIVQRDRDGARVHHYDQSLTVPIAWLAKVFVDSRQHMRAPTAPSPDEADADAIARGFGP